MTKEEYDELTPWQKGAASVYESDSPDVPKECPYPAEMDTAVYLWNNGRKSALKQLERQKVNSTLAPTKGTL